LRREICEYAKEETSMKILIIGSSQYRDRIEEHAHKLRQAGHTVRIPAFDSHPDLDDFGVCQYNKGLVQTSDEVHMIWDRRSTGTIFDFGMVFMAGVPLKIIYLEPKTFEGVMKKYEEFSGIT
jgi:hypothetical protein